MMMTSITFSGREVLITFILLTALLIVFINLFRWILAKRSKEIQKLILKEGNGKTKIYSNRVKYEALSIEKFSRTFFRLSLLLVMMGVFVAFNWTSEEHTSISSNSGNFEIDEVIEQIPNTFDLPKPKPKIPEVILEIESDLVEEDSVELMSMDIFEEDAIFSEPEIFKKEEVKERMLPLPISKEDDKPIIFAQVMPRFPGCEDMQISSADKEVCSKKKLLEYVYSHLKYPALARETGIEGMVVIRFVVNKKGRVEDINIVRDIGGGCGNATKEVIKKMNAMGESWNPGRQQGRPVKVLYTLPIRFKLEG